MSKDVIIAGALAVGCIALIAVAFIAPKSKPTDETPKDATTTTITDPGFGGTPGFDSGFNGGAPTNPAFPPTNGSTGLPPGGGFPPTPGGTSGAGQPGDSGLSTRLPGPAPTPVEAPAPVSETKTHTVAQGELLGDIALKYYGSSKAWRKIQDANPGVDPRNLKVGQKLVIPPSDTAAAAAPAPVVTAPGERTYTVKAGDSLYSIAKKELGSASRWKEIEQLNNLSSNDLRVGQTIKLPAAASAAPAPAPLDTAVPAAGGKTHTVAKGETLGDISRQYYGTTKSWKKIADANPGISPENLKVGQKLVIPEGDAPAPAPGATTGDAGTTAEYVVKSGDTLSTIAQRELGSKNRWKEIQDANPGLDPRNLRAGQKLKIPGKGGTAPAPSPEPVQPQPALPRNDQTPPGAPFGATGPRPGTTATVPPTQPQPTTFPADPGFSSPYGGAGFAQPAQPFGGTASPDPFAGSQPSPFVPPPADQSLR